MRLSKRVMSAISAAAAAAMLLQGMAAGIGAEDMPSGEPAVSYDGGFFADEAIGSAVINGGRANYRGVSADMPNLAPAGAASVVQLESGVINYSSSSSIFAQTLCERKNGIYFLSGGKLVFYSLEDNTSSEVCTFNSPRSGYFANDKLYLAYSKSGSSASCCRVFDLINEEWTEYAVVPEYINAVGADGSGRIYIAGTDPESSSPYIWLYSPSGELLSSVEAQNTVYDFYGFASNGAFCYEEYGNWRYWGYDHYGRFVQGGAVENNTLSLMNTGNGVNLGGLTVAVNGIEYIYQSGVYPHQKCAGLFGDKYLVAVSAAFGRKQIIGLDDFELIKSLTNYKGTEDEWVSGSYGTRTVYSDIRGTLITSGDGNMLEEYDPVSDETVCTYEAAHHIFSLMISGDDVIIVEKEDGNYYIETVKWKDASALSLEPSAASVRAGKTMTITPSSDSALAQKYVYTSSNPSVATVTPDGVVAGWKEGVAVITCSTVTGSASATARITVTAADITAVSPSAAISGAVTNNAHANNYTVWSSTVNSYLCENSDGSFTRVEYYKGKVIVENYTKNNALTSSKDMEPELPIFGGFFSGAEYNYLVFGQQNSSESDETEIMRVVKYSKDWTRLGAFSAYGANTYIPFDAGSLRMAEAGDHLYVYTCHEMYASGDSVHHQANMTYVIDAGTMTEEQSYYDVMNVSYGYVSHSFNQFVQSDGEYLFRVDHGDASPRGVYLSTCPVGSSITRVSYWTPFGFKSSSRYNYNATGASVGGMELSASRVLIAGNSIDQSSDTSDMGDNRNIFILSIAKDMSDKNMTWLTDYTAGDNVTVRTPQLVKLTDEHFLALWEEYSSSTRGVKVKAALISADGTAAAVRELDDGYVLSDCQPVAASYGTVKWYASDGSAVTMYEYSPFASHMHEYGEEWISDESGHCRKCISCGEISEVEEHIPDIDEPTADRAQLCKVCGYVIKPAEDPADKLVVPFVDRLYEKFFDRTPSDEEKQNHLVIVKTMTAAKDVENFIHSPEFISRGVNDEEFVNIMYNVFFDRDAGTEGAGWVKALENGCSRDRIFYGFIGAPEFGERCAEAGIEVGTVTLTQNRDKNPEVTAFVAQLYRNALDTERPDEAGLNSWTGVALDGGRESLGTVAYGFIFSPQFAEQYPTNEAFVRQLYLALFGREANDGEDAGWITAMTEGSTRKDVFDGFIGSPECGRYFDSFGI